MCTRPLQAVRCKQSHIIPNVLVYWYKRITSNVYPVGRPQDQTYCVPDRSGSVPATGGAAPGGNGLSGLSSLIATGDPVF